MIDFARVITVRERKTDASKKNESRAYAACQAARTQLAIARVEMEDFAERLKTLEVELLSDLLKTRITVHDVAVLRDRLNDARDKALQLVENVKEAQAHLEMREEILEGERRKTLHLQSKLKRITELDKKLIEVEAMNQIKVEDAKMDEFVDTMSARGKI